VARDAGRRGDLGDRPGRAQPAGLGGLEGEHVGPADRGQPERVGGDTQALVGHDGNGQRPVDLGERLELAGGDGLLDEVDAGLDQCGEMSERGEPVPAGVEVDPDARDAGELLGDGPLPRDVLDGVLGTHLELEAVVQSGVELAERLLDDSGRWFGAKCPGDRDGSPGQAAEKGVQGDVEAAGPCVV
jgi:hypothetical protein